MTRTPRPRAVRAMRVTISPRFATSNARIARGGCAGPLVTPPSDERDTRTREPTLVAGSLPSAIQRWTVRTVTPSSSATARGVRSSGLIVAIVAEDRRSGVAPPRRPLVEKGAQALLALGRGTLLRDVSHGVAPRLVRSEGSQLADQGLRGPRRRRAGRSKLIEQRFHPCVQSREVVEHLVDEADRPGTVGIEPRAAGEERAGMRLADLGKDEGADDGRDDAEPRLREPEGRVPFRDDDVRHRAQPHRPTQGRAVDADDDGHRAGVDRAEHGLHGRRVAFVVGDGQAHRGPHPVDVGAGAEDGPFAGQDDPAQGFGWLARELVEGGAQLSDELRVERVAHLRPIEDDPREGAVPRDAQSAHRPRPRRWKGSATARTWASSGSSSQTTSVSSGTSTVAEAPMFPTRPSIRRGCPSGPSLSTR